MKKFIMATLIALTSTAASAHWYYVNGVVYSNFCRAGMYWVTLHQYAPVGTPCYVRDWNGTIWNGYLTQE